MLTYEDCIGMSDLTSEEVDAIAEHEHVPSIVALEMGCHMLNSSWGTEELRRFIEDDIRAARARGDAAHAACLSDTLRDFRKRCGTLAA